MYCNKKTNSEQKYYDFVSLENSIGINTTCQFFLKLIQLNFVAIQKLTLLNVG